MCQGFKHRFDHARFRRTLITTRMHSSKMSTVRSLLYGGVLSRGGGSLSRGGGLCPGEGVSVQGGSLSGRAPQTETPSPVPVNRMTHANKKHYLAPNFVCGR